MTGHVIPIPAIYARPGKDQEQRGAAGEGCPLQSTQTQGPSQKLGIPWVEGHPPAARLPSPDPHCASLPGRGGMIQTCEQYQFVHHVMSLYEKQLSRQGPE